jgi:hypothetical protein
MLTFDVACMRRTHGETPDQCVDILNFQAAVERVSIHLTEDVVALDEPALLRRKAGNDPAHDEGARPGGAVRRRYAALCAAVKQKSDASLSRLSSSLHSLPQYAARVRPAAGGRLWHRVLHPFCPRLGRMWLRSQFQVVALIVDTLSGEPPALAGTHRRAFPPAARLVAETDADALAHKQAQLLRSEGVVRLYDQRRAFAAQRHRARSLPRWKQSAFDSPSRSVPVVSTSARGAAPGRRCGPVVRKCGRFGVRGFARVECTFFAL